MLQRLLQVDGATATALKGQLLENGIISAKANAYGIHTAVKPLYENAFVSTHETRSTAKKVIDKISEKLEESIEDQAKEDININTLEPETESVTEPEDSQSKSASDTARESPGET